MTKSIKAIIPVLIACLLIFAGTFWLHKHDYRLLKDIAYFPDSESGLDIVDMQRDLYSSNSLKMELVTIFHLVYEASDNLIRQREKEYVKALQINLDHDHVKRIHILTTDADILEQRLKNFQLPNKRKLVIVERNSVNMTRDIYDYISENLVGVDVMFLNGDIYLGGGFHCVDPIVMRKNKIMYTLTRQVKKEEACGERDKCRDSGYGGSHDTFLFHLTEPIPESALQHLNFEFPSWGVENVVMWVFKTKLGYCLLNPCTILETFHLHCSKLRKPNRIRVNNASNTGRAPSTKELVCNSREHALSQKLATLQISLILHSVA